nr:MAG TPA: hypothetical protein [Bacteriophage sp.]
MITHELIISRFFNQTYRSNAKYAVLSKITSSSR